MSAFIVGHDHIDALLTFALDHAVRYRAEGQNVPISDVNVTEVGQILLHENERSVRHRYNDYSHDDFWCDGQSVESYEFKPFAPFPDNPLAILKACDGYDYQACETDDYEDSLAWRIIAAIREKAAGKLPGYDNAPGWTFDRSDVPADIAA